MYGIHTMLEPGRPTEHDFRLGSPATHMGRFIRRGAGGTQRRRELAIACNLVVPRAPAPIEFPLEGNVTKNVIWVVLVAGVGNASKAVTACLDADGFVSRPHDGRVLDVACWKRDGS